MQYLKFSLLYLVSFFILSGCETYKVLNPKGHVAHLQRYLFSLSISIMIFVFIVVFGMFVYFVWKYRETPQRKSVIPTYEKGNKKIEITYTVVPILLLTILAVPTVKGTFSLDKLNTYQPEGEVIKVVGHQYWWEVQYPNDQITLANEIYIPVDKTIHFELTSADTIHSFWVPNLGGKKDLIPGKTNKLALRADEIGTFDGKCAELCGASHSLMRFQVHVLSKENFNKWLKQRKTFSEPSNLSSNALKGEKIFKSKCLTCHAVTDQQSSGKTGPSLVGFGDKGKIGNVIPNNKENLKEWIKSPEKFKQDVKMPGFENLSDNELEALSDYLHRLTIEN